MTLHLWLTFAISTAVICFAPGPNMLHMMTSGAKYGLRRTLFSMAGCFLAVILMIGCSVAGIGALLTTSPRLFDALRYGGAAYLLYLGYKAWRAPASLNIDAEQTADLTPVSSLAIFRNGFLIGISNPKALLFASAFFPQFIDTSAPQLPQLLILLSTFATIEISCYLMYAIGGHRLAGMLKRARLRKAFNRLTGTLFGAFGLLLIAKSA